MVESKYFKGTIPTSFQNLVNLIQLYLIGATGKDSNDWADSTYSGDFPDLTALPLEILQMAKNFFQFEDIDFYSKQFIFKCLCATTTQMHSI